MDGAPPPAVPAGPPMIPIPPFIGKIAGPLVLGYMFNWALYGVLCIQVYIYYLSFPRDPLLPRIIVYFLFILETLQTILNTSDAFNFFGLGYGNLLVLDDVHFAWFAVPFMSGVISFIVQVFYAYRITVLSNSKTGKAVAGITFLIALTQCVGAIVEAFQTRAIGKFSRIQSEAFIACIVWLAGSAICDVIIAVAMTIYLWSAKTGFRSTQVLLTKLVRLTIETGTITAAVAVIDVALFLTVPNANYHTAPALCLAKMYSNTLLVMLNARSKIVGGREEMYTSHEVTSGYGGGASGAVQTGTMNGTMGGSTLVKGITISREMWKDSEDHEMSRIEQQQQEQKSRWNNA